MIMKYLMKKASKARVEVEQCNSHIQAPRKYSCSYNSQDNHAQM